MRLGGAGQNNIMIDGISAMDTGNNGQMLHMNVDAIGEMRILPQGYQAEYDRSSGVQSAGVTKSGTNQCRGSAYDSQTNSDWDSNSWLFFQAEDGIRDLTVTGVQTCALPIWRRRRRSAPRARSSTRGGAPTTSRRRRSSTSSAPSARTAASSGRPRGSTSRRCRSGRRSEEHTSELQSQSNIVCRLLLEKKKTV